MIDFHAHVLPGMDDGAEDLETSLAMLRESYRQDVDLLCATSHFYADEEDPASFLVRRAGAYAKLQDAIGNAPGYPRILLGAEILYFPGISVAEELEALCLQRSPFLLVEPPMMPWSEHMLDEIEQCGENLHCVPVLAHIDRYMRLLNDYSLFDRVKDRRMLVQVNASFFLHQRTQALAVESLKAGRFQFIGSDCHDLEGRSPNLGYVVQLLRDEGVLERMEELDAYLYSILSLDREA